jgi:hypothetical protein
MGRARGFRSSLAAQRRYAEALIASTAYHDKAREEVVQTLSRESLMVAVIRQVGDCSILTVSRYEQGEVRTDSLGRGTLQYPDKLEALKTEKGWKRD